MVDEDDLTGVEQVVRDDERANRVLSHNAAGVSDDVGLACSKAEKILDVNAGIHARHNGHVLGRGNWLLPGVLGVVHGLAGRVARVVLKVNVSLGHFA